MPTEEHTRRTTAPLVLVGLMALCLFINYIDRGNLATGATQVRADLDLSATSYGALAASFYFAYAFCQLPAGALADRFGGKLVLGEMGQLLPTLAKKYDLRDAVFLAELNLDQLLARRNAAKSFKSLPQFPSIRRDVAMLVGEAVTHDAVLDVVKKAKPANLENVELFDVFRGQNVPTGQKSVAYAFTYRAADKTLTDAEVNAAHDKVVADFKQKLQAEVRG